MRRAIRFGCVVLISCLCVQLATGQARTNPRNAGVVLRTAPAPRNINADYSSALPEFTIWRYYETWATDVARADDGKLVRVDPYDPRSGFEPAKLWKEQNSGRNGKELRFPLQPAAKVSASAPPPADWTKAEFDDSSWVRTAYPMCMHYRAIAQQCLRGKFEVTNPAEVKELTLNATVQGGAVIYLNGKEIGRVGLAAGEIKADTLAEDYPKEAFLHTNGTLLLPQVNNQLWILPQDEYAKAQKDPALADRYNQRFRAVKVTIPGKSLQKGTNVLAIDVRRAPANPAMFEIVSTKEMGYNSADQRNWWWNRCELATLSLTADPPAAAVVGRVGRPKGVEIWNWPISARVDMKAWGDSGEKLSAIRMAGARNGAFHGQVVVSAIGPIANLKASIGELKAAGGASIPPAAVTLRFAQYNTKSAGVAFDALEDSAAAVIEPPKMRYGSEGAAQPIWLSVAVPADAKAGDYAGTLTVSADGLPETKVPVELHVSDFALPDPKEYKTHIGFVQSPDTLSIRYGTPMWSEDHWKLIEKSFAILGTVATKEITIPLLRKTHFGNEHAMLYWTKQVDGSYKPDFTIIERYLDLAVKHLGKVPVVIFYVSEGEEGRTVPYITELDAKTGELKEAKGPAWGTDAGRAFWKPAVEGFKEMLAKRGMEKSLMFGYHADGGNGPECAKEAIADLKTMAPDARWVRVCHYWDRNKSLDKSPNGNPWGRVGLVSNYGVYWDPDADQPFFGWRNPHIVTAYTRGTFNVNSALHDYRTCAEAILLSGRREAKAGWGITDVAGFFGRDTFLGTKGFAPWGGDFWPILKGRAGYTEIIARYNDPGAGQWDPRSSWSTVQLNNYQVTFIVGEGANGPVPTVRSDVLRESLQEAEARIYVQEALLDAKLAAKLGGDLAKRAKDLCDQRTRDLRYMSEYTICTDAKEPWKTHYVFDHAAWQQKSRQLYDVAADVSKALTK